MRCDAGRKEVWYDTLFDANIPISSTSFTVSADNAGSISLKYMDISEISDIADTDGDGEALYDTLAVKDFYDTDIDITDKHVLVVEDVIRTGLTTAYIIQNLEMKKPKEITLCSMLLNPDRLLMTIPVKYYGFEINDQWLAGYGLDRDEIGRNLPYIAQIPKRK